MAQRKGLAALVIVQALLLYLTTSTLAANGGVYGCAVFCNVGFMLPGAERVTLVSLVAATFGIVMFVLQLVIGYRCVSWQGAVVFAVALWAVAVVAHAGTLLEPYIGLGPVAGRVGGPFWIDPAHVTVLLGSLALFAALGGLGWLARQAVQRELREQP
jgi:hypothetical protein